MLRYLLLCLWLFSGTAEAANSLSGKESSEPIEITSDSLVVGQDEQTATFSGHVEAIQGELHLLSDKMIAYYGEKKNNQQNNWSIDKIKASGNVHIINNQSKASGDKGEYDAQNEAIILIGNVVLTKDGNVIKGSKMVYDLKTGQSSMISQSYENKSSHDRVKAKLIPKNKNEKN